MSRWRVLGFGACGGAEGGEEEGEDAAAAGDVVEEGMLRLAWEMERREDEHAPFH